MKKISILLMGLLLPMFAAAQTVKSPDGNVSLTFSLSGNGQPTYAFPSRFGVGKG